MVEAVLPVVVVEVGAAEVLVAAVGRVVAAVAVVLFEGRVVTVGDAGVVLAALFCVVVGEALSCVDVIEGVEGDETVLVTGREVDAVCVTAVTEEPATEEASTRAVAPEEGVTADGRWEQPERVSRATRRQICFFIIKPSFLMATLMGYTL